MRRTLANVIFSEDEEKFRVITNDVGGAFGMKNSFYPEYALAVWASKQLGCPVKWIEDRTEAILTDHHGRDNVTEASLALSDGGEFLGIRVKTTANLGAYLSTLAAGPPTIHLGGLAGVYTTPAAHVEITGVFTHTCSTAAYRGAGRPEVSFVIETTVDAAARELGMSPVEIRRQNFIPPDAIPYQTPLFFNYDSGRFDETFMMTLEAADLDGFHARKAESEAAGKLRGLGISYAIEAPRPPALNLMKWSFPPMDHSPSMPAPPTMAKVITPYTRRWRANIWGYHPMMFMSSKAIQARSKMGSALAGQGCLPSAVQRLIRRRAC